MPLRCQLCSQRCALRDQLNVHYYAQHNAVHCCPCCPLQFRDEAALEKHKRTHATDSLCCPICSQRVGGGVARYLGHLHQRHQAAIEGLMCAQCDFVGFNTASLVNHRRYYHRMDETSANEVTGKRRTSDYSTVRDSPGPCTSDHVEGSAKRQHNADSDDSRTETGRKRARVDLDSGRTRRDASPKIAPGKCRRYACGLCPFSTVYKLSLKGHVTNIHNVASNKWESYKNIVDITVADDASPEEPVIELEIQTPASLGSAERSGRSVKTMADSDCDQCISKMHKLAMLNRQLERSKALLEKVVNVNRPLR